MASCESIRDEIVEAAVAAFRDNSQSVDLAKFSDPELETFVNQTGWKTVPNLVQPLADLVFSFGSRLKDRFKDQVDPT